MDLTELAKEHEAIRRAGALLRSHLDAPKMPDPAALADARWALGMAVMTHLATEDRLLYSALERSVNADIAALARMMRDELTTIFSGYVDHAKYWTPLLIERGWEEYRVKAGALLDIVADRLSAEEKLLFPLARQLQGEAAAPSPSRDWTRDAGAIRNSLRKNL